MPTSKRTFRMFVEEELGEFPHFLVGAMLEWLLIASLFIDGFLAFLSNKFATLFELEPPCVLCTRIDRSLVGTNPSSYYNDNICKSHKKDISSLAYCHVHRKLSDIKSMCEGCLLSFTTEKEPDSDTNKLIEQKDVDTPKDGDRRMALKPVRTGKEINNNRVIDASKCLCCGDPLKMKPSSKASFVRSSSSLRASSLAPAPSPRAPLTPMGWRNDDGKNMDLPHIKYTELKFISDNESDMPEEDYGGPMESKNIREDMKSTTTPLLPDSEEHNDESCKTPNFIKGNKFFGIPLSDINSPRFVNKPPKKTPLPKSDQTSNPNDDTSLEGDSILHHLKRQINVDRKTLVALYTELNEERSASAIAANNSMAMITRLQAEKASVQMEALQYQRMVEEQAEYDQEAIQMLKDMIVKQEKDIKVMEMELEEYKEKHGEIKREDSEYDFDLDYRLEEIKARSLWSYGERSGGVSPRSELGRLGERGSVLDFDTERAQLFEMLKNLENLIQASSDEDHEGQEYKAALQREMFLIRERLRIIEADTGFLKHTTMTFHRGDEGARLLTEIAHHVRKFRPLEKCDEHSEKAKHCLERPDEHWERPKEHSERPKEHLENPKDHMERPEDHSERPKENSEKPTDHLERPKEHSKKPEEHLEKPKEHSERPKEHSGTPEENSKRPEEHSERPREHSEGPREHSERQKEHSEKPEERLEKPEDTNTTNA